MSDLKKQQKNFIEYYILTNNPQESALLAGCPKEDALKAGHDFLKSKSVTDKIHKKVNYYAKNLYITRGYIINKLLDIIDFSLEKETILNKDGTETGRYKFKDAPCALRAIIYLSKLIGNENCSENNENDWNIENLNIDKI